MREDNERDDQQGAHRARPNQRRRPAQPNARSYAVIGALLFVVGWGFLLTRPSTANAQRGRSPENVSRDAGRRVDAASDEVGRWRKRYRQIGRVLGGNDNARPDSTRGGSTENRNGSNPDRASNNNRADSPGRNANANTAASTTPANGNANRPCRPPANSNGTVRPRRVCS